MIPIEGVNARLSAMLNALAMQRNQTADEVVNLLGDLADAREKIVELEKKLADLQPVPSVAPAAPILPPPAQ
jgi:hypothetical protein